MAKKMKIEREKIEERFFEISGTIGAAVLFLAGFAAMVEIACRIGIK